MQLDAAKERINELENEVSALSEALDFERGYSKQGWISVEERLPELWQDVLVYPIKLHLGDEPVYTSHLCGNGDWTYVWAGASYKMAKVTRWMPLPDPPKEKGE
jgi:hypothetical protein